MPKEELQKHAQGRVWSGKRALDIGLIDGLGGVDRAISIAKQEAGIGEFWNMNGKGNGCAASIDLVVTGCSPHCWVDVVGYHMLISSVKVFGQCQQPVLKYCTSILACRNLRRSKRYRRKSDLESIRLLFTATGSKLSGGLSQWLRCCLVHKLSVHGQLPSIKCMSFVTDAALQCKLVPVACTRGSGAT